MTESSALIPSPLHRGIRFFLVLSLLLFVGCGGDEFSEQDENQTENQSEQENQEDNQGELDPEFFDVSGTVTGLEVGGLTLQNNGTDDFVLGADGPFTFATSLEDGDSYEVTVLEAPADHECEVQNGSGTIEGADITDVEVQCEWQVVEGPFFSVTIEPEESTLEVEERGTIVVVAEVRNRGTEVGNQTISLTIDGATRDSVSFPLINGSYQQVTLEWETADGDAGTYEVEVASEDDSDNAQAIVTERDTSANFTVEIDDAQSIFDAAVQDSVVIVAQVENIGEDTGTQDIVFEANDDLKATFADLTLDGGLKWTPLSRQQIVNL